MYIYLYIYYIYINIIYIYIYICIYITDGNDWNVYLHCDAQGKGKKLFNRNLNRGCIAI